MSKECTCDDLTELERYYGDHYDDCPLSDYKEPDAPLCD